MPRALRFKDGFPGPGRERRDEVRRLQRRLRKAGYEVDSDGLFGKGTEEAVKAFQRANGLGADGVVGSNTWQALRPKSKGGKLKGFHGDLRWVHAREGHAGKAYWPGGASGVTLDPGVDLGHAKASLVESAYKSLLNDEQFKAVEEVLGIRGENAKDALNRSQTLKRIRISREQADTIFHFAAEPYWRAIVKRFPNLAASDTLGSVQTVMLSISYNRGANNRALEVLKEPIEEEDWSKVADIVGAMQQDHRLAGIRKRRRLEAELIRTELG